MHLCYQPLLENPPLIPYFFNRSRDHELYDHHGDYDRYATPPPQTSKHSTHHAQYDSSSYERDYRREYHPHSSSSSYAAAYPGKIARFLDQ